MSVPGALSAAAIRLLCGRSARLNLSVRSCDKSSFNRTTSACIATIQHTTISQRLHIYKSYNTVPHGRYFVIPRSFLFSRTTTVTSLLPIVAYHQELFDPSCISYNTTLNMSSMDLGGITGQAALDASRLSDADKRELQQFVQNESQKAGIQDSTSPRPSFSILHIFADMVLRYTPTHSDVLQEMHNSFTV